VFFDMVTDICRAVPQIRAALAVGGQHRDDVLGELREIIVSGLRRRGYDL
jgi:hypothetical protein